MQLCSLSEHFTPCSYLGQKIILSCIRVCNLFKECYILVLLGSGKW